MASRHGRLFRRAQAEAELRYRPQERTLHALVDKARQDLRTDQRVAAGTAATAVRSARQSRSTLRKIYSQAASGVKVAQGDLDAAFGRAGVGADNPFAIVTDRENAAYRQRLTTAAAQARKETVRQENEARLGKLFDMGSARQRYNQTVHDLRQQGLDLSGEKRLYLLSALGKYQESRASRRSQQKIAETYANAKGGGGSGSNGKPKFDKASRSESKLFTTAYAEAIRRASDSKAGGDSRADASNKLINGRHIKGLPALPKIGDQLAVRAALDMAYKGYVTPATAKLLRDRGFRVGDLSGAKTRKQQANRFGGTKKIRKQQLTAAQKRAKQYAQGNVY